MRYLKALNSQITEYPYSLAKLKAENPNTSFPSELAPALLAEHGVYPVVPMDKPEATIYQRVVRTTPIFVNGAWHEQWALVDAAAPRSITALQFRRESRARNRKAQFLNWLSTASENVQEYFQFTDIIRQSDAEFQEFVTAQNFTQTQVDQFFIAASKR
jgi:hypothetical protein